MSKGGFIHKHVRRFDPMAFQGCIRGACRCGWHVSLPLSHYASPVATRARREELFVEHLAAEDAGVALLVNQQPGQEEVLLMPIGKPVAMHGWEEKKGMYFGRLADGSLLPVAELRLANGKVFKSE